MQEKVHDFGRVSQGEKLSHTFTIKNKGDSALEIKKIVTACGCTAAVVDSKLIAPGTSTSVEVTFDTEGFRGQKEKKISIYTNDSENTTLIITVKATIVADVWTQPSRLFFGSISAKSETKKSFLVLSRKEDSIKIKNIRSRSPNIEVSSEPYSKGDEIGKKVFVTLKGTNADGRLALGGFRSRVSVTTSSKQEPVINLPVLANIYGDLKVSPKSVSFGVIKSSKLKEASQVFTITNTSSAPVNITAIENANSSITVSKEVIEEGMKYRIKVGLKAPVEGIVQSRIVIKTDNKDPKQSQLHLPVYAIIDSETE